MFNRYEVQGNVTFLYTQYKGESRCILVSTSDLDLLLTLNKTWRIQRKPHSDYAITSIYVAEKKSYRNEQLHTFLCNTPKDMVVDHINGNGLDNRRENLRVITQSENLRNRKGATKVSKTGIRNVVWNEQRRKYYVYVTIEGKNRNFGGYTDIKEAEIVAKAMRKHYFGME